MVYQVLLLTFLLAVAAEGQSTTATPPSTTNSKAEQATTGAVVVSTDTTSTEDDDMKPAGSSDRFTFTQADALKSKTLPSTTKPDNDLSTEGDDEDPMEELAIFERLLSGSVNANEGDGTAVAKIKDSKNAAGGDDNDDDNDDDDDEEGDDDSDEDGESNPKPSSDTANPLLVRNPEDVQLRRQGDLRPGFGMVSNNEDSRQAQDISNKPDYLSAREQAVAADMSSDGSPLLQLTQGGYRRPYQPLFGFDDQRQRMRSVSASQQSETLEAPRVSGISGDQPRQPVPQVEYTAPYQPQLNLGARPMFQQIPEGFGGNGILSGGLQNNYFHTPPAGFTDFSSANFQSQFHPADNGGFSAVPRDQSVFSLFQTSPRQNPGMFYQGIPQYPQPQPMVDNNPRPAPTLFHPGSFTNFPNLDIVEDAPRANYNPYMRHPAMNPQFQINPNFYGANSGANDFSNPGINLQPNFPGNNQRQTLQPQLYRYPMPDSQITSQSSDQVEKQKQDSADPTEETKTKDPDALKASQDQEDPTSVPFGVRIRQNNAPDQNAFLSQRDVYLRYPAREAGYATEENLPVQNTTENTNKNTDPSSSNPPFPFFTSPREFRPFSNPDPYRNALNTLQQSYANNRNVDDSNQTGESPVDQYARNAGLARPPNQLFTPYQRSQEVPVFQNRPFYPVPGLDGARNPFYQLPGVPENSYLFAGPGPVQNAEDSNKIPVCAQDNNASICFEDTNYPKRELLYALNSDPFLMERLTGPNQIVEDVTLDDQKSSDDSEDDDNYICKSDVKYGLPLRAKNVKGTWKVIANLDDGGSRRFKQPVRVEICRAVNQPCSFTQVKTACIQKYTLQRLLSWNPEKGIHTDVYKLPVACSCQIVNEQGA